MQPGGLYPCATHVAGVAPTMAVTTRTTSAPSFGPLGTSTSEPMRSPSHADVSATGAASSTSAAEPTVTLVATCSLQDTSVVISSVTWVGARHDPASAAATTTAPIPAPRRPAIQEEYTFFAAR